MSGAHVCTRCAGRCHAEANMHWCFVFHTVVCRDSEATNAILDQTIDKDKMCFVSRQTT